MMGRAITCKKNVVNSGFVILLFINACAALPMCIDSRAPQLSASLSFCSDYGYKQKGCCSKQEDTNLLNKFESMNVSDKGCAGFIKQILCAECDQYAADLIQSQIQEQRVIPVLCNSTIGTHSSTNDTIEQNYCSNLWNACQNVSIVNSPFAPLLKGGALGSPTNMTHAKLIELWQSKNDFCAAFGGTIIDGVSCFNVNVFVPNVTQNESTIEGVCLERIGDEAYLNLVPHPDGSNRVFLSSQAGQVWLATLPDSGSGKQLILNKSNPFIDLSDQMASGAAFGLMGLAFHPNFEKNGRFFVSFNCDKTKSSICAGRCACNSDVGCDPSQLGTDDGALPCQYHSVIAEYSANGTSTSPSQATFAQPTEIRRIFTMGLPYASHHGGQILFGPTDNYLYFMMGDGGSIGDPYNFAQKQKSLLGKIMRLDVDNIPKKIRATNLWGNYSIPSDNPYVQDDNWQPEIWALGLRNPWRCSFDLLNPTYFFCADVGQEVYEEVDLVTKGGNYGWRVYEGFNLYIPPSSPGGNTSANSIQPILPVLGYDHNSVNRQEGSASITGGYLSRSNQDACLYGRYLYADLYAANMWAGIENPIGSGNFSSTAVNFNCSAKSPIPCLYAAQTKYPTLNYIFSFGEDNRKDVYVLASNGVYRVVHPSDCNYVCKKESLSSGPSNVSQPSPSPSQVQSPSGSSAAMAKRISVWLEAFLLVFSILI
ncbi:HIPL1 protein isoform X2 [Cryptomeria japonica]|uniref:HIPL1 protein isoform X2 n=1 Tax=Cryptomeria japonica TaxID=3369 RepID=UPI0027D9D0BC|nr:HIPL1 protein isoform X2 [Cryptomeria japonica]